MSERKRRIVYDTEIIGLAKPCFLICAKDIDTSEQFIFWGNKKRDRDAASDFFLDPNNTFISFNGIKFDQVLISMWLWNHDEHAIKAMANKIILERLMPWDAYKLASVKMVEYDHIDLLEVAPGVMTSLKVYAGRMRHPTMIDLPYHHDQDLTPSQKKVLAHYCANDLAVTEALYRRLQDELTLREELSLEHGIDLRSKSDAQVAEAILKKTVGIYKRVGPMPSSVRYVLPKIIKTKDKQLLGLIHRIEEQIFDIDHKTRSPLLPAWLEQPVAFGKGVYQVGIGGLHSKHDKKVCHRASADWIISDFDVASYYPSIILKCGLIPNLGANKGELFIDAYRDIFDRRLAAKRAGDKKTANSLKISLNGTYGKLGSQYSPFYAPDLMLAVTLTGQINLLWLIVELEKIKQVEILSCNTDGITVGYPPTVRDMVLNVFAKNSKQTGFEYEENFYRVLAMKDVNNYYAVVNNPGKKEYIKAKGLYADDGLMKNPTNPVVSQAVGQFLLDGTDIATYIKRHQSFSDFTAIRNVTGGAEQQGKPLGRVVRWYMSSDPVYKQWYIQYAKDGKKVPKTEGGKACMTLMDTFPDDLDYDWYIADAHAIINDIGL